MSAEIRGALKAWEETAKSARAPETRELLESLGRGVSESGTAVGLFFEHLFRKADHDSVFLRLPDGTDGAVYLTEWLSGWSVKWYSLDRKKQITLVDGVREADARKRFAALREELARLKAGSGVPGLAASANGPQEGAHLPEGSQPETRRDGLWRRAAAIFLRGRAGRRAGSGRGRPR